MKTRAVMAVVAVLGLAARADAQFVGCAGWHGGFAHHGGFAFGYGGPPHRFGAFGGGFVARTVVVGPAVPVYGWGPAFFAPPPPLVVFPPPFAFPPDLDDPPPLAARPPAAPPLAKRGDFVVFRPQKNGVAADGGVITPKVERVAAGPPPAFRFDPFAKRDHAGRVEPPDPDPATESARRMKLARAAFAAEHYGTAVEHLGAASKARPDDALPHFLLGQVRFAAGRYAEAVAHVRDGLRLAPEWPAGTFRAKEWYTGAEARFDAHLAELAKAADGHPDEPGLTFLLGYQLWFGGDKAAATKLFRAAAVRVKDASMVERFLRVAEE